MAYNGTYMVFRSQSKLLSHWKERKKKTVKRVDRFRIQDWLMNRNTEFMIQLNKGFDLTMQCGHFRGKITGTMNLLNTANSNKNCISKNTTRSRSISAINEICFYFHKFTSFRHKSRHLCSILWIVEILKKTKKK